MLELQDKNTQSDSIYAEVTPHDIEALKAMLPGQVFVAEAISRDYSHDEFAGFEVTPDVLVKPKTTEEVSEVMTYAYEHRIPILARGSGTGLVGGAVPLYNGIVLDLTEMNQILELDGANMSLRVQPGVLLMDLQAYVEAQDYFYPPDPGEKSATIGGNISTNAGGMRAVKYGVTRDYVQALTVVMPNGEILELGGKLAKNSSGYSLKDLIIGSEGTLAVITEAQLRILPLPAHQMSLLIPFDSMEEAIRVVPLIFGTRVIPTAVEFMSRDTILFAEEFLRSRFPHTTSAAYLLLTFDHHHEGALQEELRAVADLCLEEGAIDAFIVDTEERSSTVWNARGAFLEAIKASTTEMDECDVVVPRSAIVEFLSYANRVAGEVGLRLPSFGHAGDGNLHLYLCRDDLAEEIFEDRKKELFELLYDKSAELGGQVSGEHGIGWAKQPYLASQLGETQIALMQGIKEVFDPRKILNPGKVCYPEEFY